MIPPRYPRPPHNILTYQEQQIPIPNNPQRNSSSRQKHQYLKQTSSIDSKSRVSKYEHLRTQQQKRTALGKLRYINQLAYLDYEDKYIEIHTKYTVATKISAMKKIKAKNQMAEFVEQEEENELAFQQLMDYKYGRQSNNDNFFFETNQLANQYKFCPQCDAIHNDHSEVHQKICRDKVLSTEDFDKKNQHYVYFSLARISNALKRTSGQEYDELKEIVASLIKIEEKSFSPNSKMVQSQDGNLQTFLKYLNELLKVNSNDNILKGIGLKILKQLYKRNSR